MCPNRTRRVGCIMGLFDFLKSPKKETLDAQQPKLKSSIFKPSSPEEYLQRCFDNSIFYGRIAQKGDIVHVEKREYSYEPSKIMEPSVQRYLSYAPIGDVLFLKLGSENGKPIFRVETKFKQFVGQFDFNMDDDSRDKLLYDMLSAKVQVTCALAEKYQFYHNRNHRKYWSCKIDFPVYDFWSETGADVWTTRTGQRYHFSEKCSKASPLWHMQEAEALRRGKVVCPKCSDCRPSAFLKPESLSESDTTERRENA